MSAATAEYILGEDEALQCRDCGKMLRGSDQENDHAVITADPDGMTIEIRCPKCQRIYEDDMP